jgi:serine/threonine protein kinase
MSSSPQPSIPEPIERRAIQPAAGELITSLSTNNTYTIGERIGEGNFGVVDGCTDVWRNDLAAKVLKPTGGTYEEVQAAAQSEFGKLFHLRHPNITYVFDAFEFRDTFYIITERCYCPLNELFISIKPFLGMVWLLPIARCLLQAIHYLHPQQYAHQDIHLGNVFAAFAKNELDPSAPGAIQFKLGDLGVTKLFSEMDAANTLAEWIRPPEAIDPSAFGPLDARLDIYHLGLLFLQLAHSRELRFTREEILQAAPGKWRRNFRRRITSLLKRRLDVTSCSGQKPRWNCGGTSTPIPVAKLPPHRKHRRRLLQALAYRHRLAKPVGGLVWYSWRNPRRHRIELSFTNIGSQPSASYGVIKSRRQVCCRN